MEVEGSAGQNPKSAAAAGGGANSLLANLPFRGTFCSTIQPSNPGVIREYICEHDTSPPEGQLIKTNQTNILIRALLNNKQKSDSNARDGKGRAMAESAKGKRAAERPVDGRSTAKRAHLTLDSRSSPHDGSSSRTSGKDFQSLTVDKLRAILKERGLSTKGRKDELIARLRGGRGDNKA